MLSKWLERIRQEAKPQAEALRKRVQAQVDAYDTGRINPELRERAVEFVENVGRYFDPEVRGLARLPAQGPYLLVGNHSGGAYTPDTPIFMAAFLRHWGMDKPLRPLAHNVLFSIPQLGDALSSFGLLPASPGNAAKALSRGEPVFVYPGGDYESQRPYFESSRIDFGGRKGFIKLALEHGIPVIPVVCHGSNETVVTVTRGEKLARLTGLTHITRTKVFPFRLSFPFGLVPSGVPYIPLPSRITIEVGHPMAWQDFTREDARNEAVIDALYRDIVSTMQRTLNGLYAERPNPYASRKQRFVMSQHSPVPKPPARALELRERAVVASKTVHELRPRKSSLPPKSERDSRVA